MECGCSPYDTLYLAIAIREGVPMFTFDQKFVATLSDSPYREIVHLL